MLGIFCPHRSSLDAQLYPLLVNPIFKDNPIEVRVTREYTCHVLPNSVISGVQPTSGFPRMSISSRASISAVRPASCQRPGGIAPPDQHALPPRPSSPLQIVNDLNDDDHLTYPSSYRHLSVEAWYPAYSLSWFVTQRPSLHIRKGLLVELVLTYKETTLTTRARLAKISHVGPTWVHFRAECEDTRGYEPTSVQLVVPRIWTELPRYYPILALLSCEIPIDIHEPFDPAGDRQIHNWPFVLPDNIDPEDVERVEQLRWWSCKMDILTGKERYYI